jgi:pimeloyl-ACP methyl ester carboxylesterase
MAGFTPHPLDFGHFTVPKLLNPIACRRKVTWLHNELDFLRQIYQCDRFSLIAHSFGTYLISELLERYPDHRFDKLILVGSIVREDFPWNTVLEAWQVRSVLNEYGCADPWPAAAARLVPRAGPSGRDGFSGQHVRLHQSRFSRYAHSDSFSAVHFERYWLNALRGCVVDPETENDVGKILHLAVQNVAKELQLNQTNLRANIFIEQQTGRLSIPAGFHLNMHDPAELAITMDVGSGATGSAYKAGQSVIAVLRENWGAHDLPNPQLRLVSKDLRWIISTPIPDPRSRWGVCGVVNIDCLLYDLDKDHLGKVLPHLALHANALGQILAGLSRFATPTER